MPRLGLGKAAGRWLAKADPKAGVGVADLATLKTLKTWVSTATPKNVAVATRERSEKRDRPHRK